MNSQNPAESDLARLESVLRSAATWEPDSPAPIGLVSRALSVRGSRRSRRKAVYGIAIAMTVASAAIAAAMILNPTANDSAQPLLTAPLTSAAYPPPDLRVPGPSAKNQKPEYDEIKITNAFEKKRVRSKPIKFRLRTVRPGKPQRAVVAKAELHDEIVHCFETGVIAPVMISTPDPDSGETILQTSLIKLPIEHGEYIEKTDYDSSHIKPVSNEEN